MRWLAVLWLALTLAARADLGTLLEWQRLGDSGAYVSSGFQDWRTVSKYRRHPGLHNGYDIAMRAGTPVRAAWPGVVVAVTPWYGSEFGVTVRSADGTETTYGHIAPWVAVGRRVEAGTILGSVVVDHVDVKMKDAGGTFVDFARQPVTLAEEETAPPPPPAPPESPLVKRLERLAKDTDLPRGRPVTDTLVLGQPEVKGERDPVPNLAR